MLGHGVASVLGGGVAGGEWEVAEAGDREDVDDATAVVFANDAGESAAHLEDAKVVYFHLHAHAFLISGGGDWAAEIGAHAGVVDKDFGVLGGCGCGVYLVLTGDV